MSTLRDKVDDFLGQKRIGVAGVTRSAQNTADFIYNKFRGAGYNVIPINPNAETYDGQTCYPDVKSVPGGIDGVVLVTRPDVTLQVVKDCAEAGVKRVWMHRSFGEGSVSEEAAAFCQANGISVIAGACPMMYLEPDIGHSCLRFILGVTGGLPK